MTEVWTTRYMCMDVANFMRNERYPKGYDIFQKDDGTPLSPPEALAWLSMEKAKGRKVIPVSSKCGSPCPQAALGCTGFDYQGKGCPGHPSTRPHP